MEEEPITTLQKGLQVLSLDRRSADTASAVAGPKPPPTLSSFPPELLLEIFHFLWQEDQIQLLGLSSSSLQALRLHMKMTVMPHSVSNVCTYWDAICALEPKFWNQGSVMIGLAEDADTSTHYPSPASRLERHLSRVRGSAGASPIINVFIKSCPGFDDLKFKEQSDVFSEFYERFKARWPGKKEDQEAGERTAVRELVSVLRRYTDKVKLNRLEIGTFISTSLPSVQDLYDKDASSGTTTDSSTGRCPLPPLLGDIMDTLKIDAYWTPLTYASYTSFTLLPLAPPPYPNPCIQHIPSETILQGLNRLSLSGHTFVSFCRQYLSVSGDPVRIAVGDSQGLGLKISTVRPEDGGSEHPFTMSELLTILRLLCGRLWYLSLDDVRLPLPEGVKTDDFPWIQCTGDASPPAPDLENSPVDPTVADANIKHESHLTNLSSVVLAHVNGPLVYGIEQIFKHHWDFAENNALWPRKYTPQVWWRVKEEDFDSLDNKSTEEQERIKEDAKANYSMYDEKMITSVTWKRRWKTDT